MNIRTLFKLFIVVISLIFLSPAFADASAVTSSTPVRMDGTNKKARKHRVAKKIDKSAPASTIPQVELYATVGYPDAVFNFWLNSFFSESARQEGDQIIPIRSDGTIATVFTDQKNRNLFQTVTNELKTDHAIFCASSISPIKGTMSLTKKAGWTEDDITAARKLIEKLFAPTKVMFIPSMLANKRFGAPPLYFGQIRR
ncbi:MAG TPA: hypothetical protein VHQ41_01075 [Patescibacteria group bacterium]|jgi:hypothetical protein|nr:hypothetical protein [Patescibacteria group bacterium]